MRVAANLLLEGNFGLLDEMRLVVELGVVAEALGLDRLLLALDRLLLHAFAALERQLLEVRLHRPRVCKRA